MHILNYLSADEALEGNNTTQGMGRLVPVAAKPQQLFDKRTR